jgi:hypothetical protein
METDIAEIVDFSDAKIKYSRRLPDKILTSFHLACDQEHYEIAKQILIILETMVTRQGSNPYPDRRKDRKTLVAAHERFWLLRH